MSAWSSSPVVPPYPHTPQTRRAPRKRLRTWWTRTFVWEGERFLRDGFGDMPPELALKMRRKALRSFTLAVAIGAILLGCLPLSAIGFSEPLAFAMLLGGIVLLILALICNRKGYVGLAAFLAAFSVLAADWPTIWFYQGGLTVDSWAAFDLLLLAPVLLVAVLERWFWAWAIVALNLVMIGATVALQPWAPDMQLEMTTLGGVIPAYGTVLSRPLLLSVLTLVTVGTLATASRREIARADREARQRAQQESRADLLAGQAEDMQTLLDEVAEVSVQRLRYADDIPPYALVEQEFNTYEELAARQRHGGRLSPAEQQQLQNARQLLRLVDANKLYVPATDPRDVLYQFRRFYNRRLGIGTAPRVRPELAQQASVGQELIVQITQLTDDLVAAQRDRVSPDALAHFLMRASYGPKVQRLAGIIAALQLEHTSGSLRDRPRTDARASAPASGSSASLPPSSTPAAQLQPDSTPWAPAPSPPQSPPAPSPGYDPWGVLNDDSRPGGQ